MGAVMVKTSLGSPTDLDTDDSSNYELNLPAKVKNIFIDGLARTHNELVTNQLERLFEITSFVKLMSEAHLCKLKLERMGIFKAIDVFIDISESEETDDFDVYYYVREVGRISASAGTNVGHMEGNVSMGAKLNNLRGVGETYKASISYGTKLSSAYDFSFTKPCVSNSDAKLTINALKSSTDMIPSFFKENSRGLGLNLSVPGPIGMHTLGWDILWRENLVLPSAPFDVREQCGHSLKSGLRHTLLSDGRDDWIFPSKGHLFKHNIEYCGIGGDVKAIKTDIEIQLNREILPDIVIAASVQAGGLRSLSDKPQLINDRYFIGGPLSVRGYGMRGIGQHSDLASLGGELFWASGLHLYTPLPFRPGSGGFGELFRMHFFANAGNLTNLNDLDGKEFFTNPRYSFGLGIMIIMGGMARLELNYCFPRNGQHGDVVNEGFQLGVGLNFL